MKKNISINLQGIIFHVEEDGYALLDQYLASVKRYFASYEGHNEIIADIEARMAEILLAKLNPAKQVITREDVQALIAQLGTVTDFELFDEEEPQATAPQAGPALRRLVRDVQRKVLGGIAAGIANYLSADPLWIRLIIVFLVLMAPFTAGISAGFIILLYIIFWLALPASSQLPEVETKKLFRDPDDKKLGGVASGIALYFGVDVAVIRLLFLLSVFLGGTGLLLYILFWIIVPEAKSITDKVQMKGDPVTLSSIEASVKESLNMRDEHGNENTAAKLILLPVRLLSQLIGWLGRVLGPILAFLVDLVRILCGVFLVVVSVILLMALLGLSGALLGVFNITDPASPLQIGNLPIAFFQDVMPVYGLVAAFVTGFIPALFLMLAGLALLFRRLYIRPGLGWTMFAIWLIGLFGLGTSIGIVSQQFKHKATETTEKVFDVTSYQTVRLQFNTDSGSEFLEPTLQVRTYEGSAVKLVQETAARGKTFREAQQELQKITYGAEQKDSTIMLDNYFQLNGTQHFRQQDMDLTLYLPVNKTYRVTPEFAGFFPYEAASEKFNRYPAAYHDIRVTENGMFRCLTCPASDTLASEQHASGAAETGSRSVYASSLLLKSADYGSHLRNFTFRNFREIEAGGAYHIRVSRGDTYSVQARSKDTKELKELKIAQNGETLKISRSGSLFDFKILQSREPVLIEITMPSLEGVSYSGAVKSDISGFDSPEMHVDQSGAVELYLAATCNNLILDLSGASSAILAGTATALEIDASGACRVDASRLEATRAKLEFTGACHGIVSVLHELRAEATGASHIEYKGKPSITSLEQTGASSINSKN